MWTQNEKQWNANPTKEKRRRKAQRQIERHRKPINEWWNSYYLLLKYKHMFICRYITLHFYWLYSRFVIHVAHSFRLFLSIVNDFGFDYRQSTLSAIFLWIFNRNILVCLCGHDVTTEYFMILELSGYKSIKVYCAEIQDSSDFESSDHHLE